MKNDFGEDYTKTLIIYSADSCYKYFDLFKFHLYVIDESTGHLIVYSRDECSGDESLVARFKKWDHFIIE